MNYLITGITGFVGPHLARLLMKAGHNVYGLIRCGNGRELDLLDFLTSDELSHIKFVYGDLTNYYSIECIFETYEFDGVFHLAAQSHVVKSFDEPHLTFDINVKGSMNLITAMLKYQKKCRFHFCSTSEVYGDTCKDVGILNEDSPIIPINPYAVSKAAIDLYVQERIRNNFVDGFITRAFSHTGPRRGFNFSISSDAYQIAKIMLGLQDKTLLVGNLETRRVVMDVKDCVLAYYLLMKEGCKGVYNVCGKDVYRMQYFTDMLINLSGLKNVKQKIYEPYYRPIDIELQKGDITKIRADVEWESSMPIEKTLSNLLQYWINKIKKENLD